jgi:hypothetical protein
MSVIMRALSVLLSCALLLACSEPKPEASPGDGDAASIADSESGDDSDLGTGDLPLEVLGAEDADTTTGETSDWVKPPDTTDLWSAETDGGDTDTWDWDGESGDTWAYDGDSSQVGDSWAWDGGDGDTWSWDGSDGGDSWWWDGGDGDSWAWDGSDGGDSWWSDADWIFSDADASWSDSDTNLLDAPWDGVDGSTSDIWEEIGPDAAGDDCPIDLQQIFIITDSNWLLRFEPQTLTMVPLGLVNCPAGGATPFSMSVDRDGYAWVLYSDGTLWKVHTGDATCQATNFATGQQGFDYFGMGFTSDGPNTNSETLFISGGSQMAFSFMTGSLGTIAMPMLMVSTVAPFPVGPGSPELTGTRFGELWGFFAMSTPSHVSRINKATAALEKTWYLPANLQMPQSWAFAHWGGDFYLFFKGEGQATSSAWHVSGLTGATTEVVPNMGHTITGAGVSTCAPAQ